MASPHRVQCGRNPSRAPLAQTTRRSGAGWGWAVGIEPCGFLLNGVVHEVSPLAVEGHAAQIEQGTGRRAGSMHPGPFRPALESRSLQPRHRRRPAALPPSAPIRGHGPTSAGYGSGRTSLSPSPRTSCGTPTPPTCSTPGAERVDIQALLGHVNLTTTQIYTHVDQDRMAAVVNKL